VWSAPIWYLGRPGYQVVRTRLAGRPAANPAPSAFRSIAAARTAPARPRKQPGE